MNGQIYLFKSIDKRNPPPRLPNVYTSVLLVPNMIGSLSYKSTAAYNDNAPPRECLYNFTLNTWPTFQSL